MSTVTTKQKAAGKKRAVKLLAAELAETPTTRAAGETLIRDRGILSNAIDYLDKFGYLSPDVWSNITIGDVIAGFKMFQGMFGLKRSGLTCVKTVKAMQQPRCGCPDVLDERPEFAEYVALKKFRNARLPAWRKRGLKYFIDKYVSGIAPADQHVLLAQAFGVWTQHIQLEVAETKNRAEADIIISASRGRRDNFDGPSGTLAWAYLPNGNDTQLLMMFDLDETWITDPRLRGILYFNVAAHEIGHLLGLDHSREPAALMAPTYNPVIGVPQEKDDIPRAVVRYGRRTTPAPSPPPPVNPPAPSNPSRRRVVVELSPGSTVTVDGVAV